MRTLPSSPAESSCSQLPSGAYGARAYLHFLMPGGGSRGHSKPLLRLLGWDQPNGLSLRSRPAGMAGLQIPEGLAPQGWAGSLPAAALSCGSYCFPTAIAVLHTAEGCLLQGALAVSTPKPSRSHSFCLSSDYA